MSEAVSFKIVVVGSSGVGKTAIVQRLIDDTFTPENQSTVGVEFKSFTVNLDDRDRYKLSIWDTAGQERFRSVSKAYFRNSVGAILCFGLDDPDSFNDLGGWLNDLHSLAAPNAAILMVGNKADLVEKRGVTESDAQDFAKRYDLEYIETSAKDGKNINESFIRLTKSIAEKVKKGEIKGIFQAPIAPPISKPAGDKSDKAGGCC